MEKLTAVMHYFRARPSKLFLIDGIGAIVTAFTIGVVFTTFQKAIGMPKEILIPLAVAAIVFAIYSLSCAATIKDNWKPFLKAIAIANLLYCGITAILISLFFQELSLLGIVYFIGEIFLVLTLVSVELSTAKEA